MEATMIENAIKTVNKTSASFIKEGFGRGMNLLFANNGKECFFGFDSSRLLQVQPSSAFNKSQVLNYLQTKLEY